MSRRGSKQKSLPKEASLAIEKFLELTVESGETLKEQEVVDFVKEIGFRVDEEDIISYLEEIELWQLAKDHRREMRVLLLDIETAPKIAYVWELFKPYINIDNIIEAGRMICWAAKWHRETDLYFESEHKSEPLMLSQMWHFLNKADVVVHYNGTKFDIPHINREFLKAGMTPPSPYKQVDLHRVVKGQFRFPSTKLDWVCQELEIGSKLKHSGIDLWKGCLAGDDESWAEMEMYNRRDVELLEILYDRLLPWVKAHPNRSVFSEDDRPVCRNCGSTRVHKRGVQRTNMREYTKYCCYDCGTWSRANRARRQVTRALTY